MKIRKIAKYVFLGLIGLLVIFLITLFLRKDPLQSTLENLESNGYSGGILIADGENVLVSEGYGFASCDDSVPNTAETVFSIGSITKMFTAVAIGQLEQAGQLNIDDPINQYFDDVPSDKEDITIRHLLDHTAGLETYHETKRLGDFESMDREKAQFEILHRDLLASPGAEENYSNSGYTMLALLIEKVSGQTYMAYVREHILLPAGMTSTGFWGDSFENHASTPNEILGCSAPNDWEYSWVIVGNGGMVSTIEDLHRWVLALQGNDILNDQAKTRLGLDQALAIGFGSAGGSSQHEFNATIEFIGRTNTTIVAISNRNTPRAESIARQLMFSTLQELYLPHR